MRVYSLLQPPDPIWLQHLQVIPLSRTRPLKAADELSSPLEHYQCLVVFMLLDKLFCCETVVNIVYLFVSQLACVFECLSVLVSLDPSSSSYPVPSSHLTASLVSSSCTVFGLSSQTETSLQAAMFRSSTIRTRYLPDLSPYSSRGPPLYNCYYSL